MREIGHTSYNYTIVKGGKRLRRNVHSVKDSTCGLDGKLGYNEQFCHIFILHSL